MKSKRTSNTQGLHVTYRNNMTINVTQLHIRSRFALPTNNDSVLDTIFNFLDKQPFVKSYNLVIDNTKLIKGYLISVDVIGGSFIDFKQFKDK